MKPPGHIRRLRRECHRIQQHGHCETQAQFVAISDVEIAVDKLDKSFDWQATMEQPGSGRKRKESK